MPVKYRHRPVNKLKWQMIKDIQVIEATYSESLKMMNDMNFLQSLLNFPKDEINDETVELLEVGTLLSLASMLP